MTKQPPGIQNEDDAMVFARYAAELKSQGKAEREIAATIVSLKSIGDRAEIERWNRILTAAEPRFNTAPNDPADRAVAAAQAQAAKLGVKITTSVARADDYDWGENRWDLIVLSYVGAREYATRRCSFLSLEP